jgi:leucyl/phenylalanyl-tRNA--protein transferase
MADSAEGEIGWYSPDPRAIIELESLHVPRSLRLTVKKKPFEIQLNRNFEGVMRQCALREETWISEEIIQSYVALHQLGFAHSVECWKGSELAGGLYGVALGGAFFGESMFSRKRDASKVALVYLVERLNERGFTLLDTQFVTPHLRGLGAVEIPRQKYMERLKVAIQQNCRFD